MLDVLHADHVRTARAKGLRRRSALLRRLLLRNVRGMLGATGSILLISLLASEASESPLMKLEGGAFLPVNGMNMHRKHTRPTGKAAKITPLCLI